MKETVKDMPTQAELLQQENDIWDCYNGLLISPDVTRIRKLFSRYELFQKALSVPGDIFECGVFKGAGLFYWLKLLDIFAPSGKKKVVGFDVFDKFADGALDDEQVEVDRFVSESNFTGASVDGLMGIAEQAGLAHRMELVVGDILQTAPQYVADNPGTRISLLHLDFDVYGATKAALEAFYPILTPGALVVCDEYGVKGWRESDAVDEFLKGKGIKLEALNAIAPTPTTFFVKPL